MDSPRGLPPKMDESRKRRNREHTNSKYGCAQCKARKVKCDESKPKCRSCTRRATQCHYPYGPPNTSNGLDELARLATASPHSTSTSYNNVFNPQHTLNVPDDEFYQSHDRQPNQPISGSSPFPSRLSPQSSSSYAAQPQIDPFEVNLNHFELFHHFTSSTAAAITTNSSTEKLWSVIIPRLALSNRFLMHNVLAVSALDIAHVNPSQSPSYYAQAHAHEARAFAMAQHDILNPSAENADVLFAYILTTVLYAFGVPDASNQRESPIKDGDRPRPLQSVAQCINILRGLRNIMPSLKGWVEIGPLAPLLNLQPSLSSSPHRFRDQGTEEHWSNLLLFASTTSTVGPKELEDIEIYSAAASLLRASSLKADSPSQGESNAFPMWQWAARLPGEFADRLVQLDVVPLVLIAHWCVLLPQSRQYWWTRDWVDRTMREIRSVMPEKYRPWLEWPAERLRIIRGAEKEAGLERILGREEEVRVRKRSGENEDSIMQ